MTTPLPEPTFLRPVYRVFTAYQMSEYGAAEYKRAIEDAVKMCESFDELHPEAVFHKVATAIRKLGETS